MKEFHNGYEQIIDGRRRLEIVAGRGQNGSYPIRPCGPADCRVYDHGVRERAGTIARSELDQG
jgi:hypothetical protein